VVARVEPDSPAAAAGLARGDAIAAIDGKPVHSFRDIEALSPGFAIGKAMTIATRDGRTLQLVPTAEKYKDPETREALERPRLGFAPDDRVGLDLKALLVETVPYRAGFAELVGRAWTTSTEAARSMAVGIALIATGEISVRKVGGPLRIFAIAAESAQQGLDAFLWMMSIISINLGLMNLLPIPVLDGGHIVTALLEGVTRRRLSLRVREVANWVGLALVLALMAVALTNDIRWIRG
jgi:regulator of sigma E protease